MNSRRPARPPDPYDVLGVTPQASHAEINTAFRRAVRACHPDAARPDRERLAVVLAAYRLLRDPEGRAAYDRAREQPSGGTAIPVRVHHRQTGRPDLWAGPVRYHPPR